jgi:hypothetical protein
VSHWHLGAMNDATFIINKPPFPAPDDTGPYLASNGPKSVSGAIDDGNGKLIVDAHNAVVAEKDATIARLSAELAAAREALEPFAEAAENQRSPQERDDECSPGSDWYVDITLGDLRRARAVLAKLSKGA